MGRQDENDVGAFDEYSIIDRIMCERSDIRVGIKTMKIIKNLPIVNIDIPKSLLSRLIIKVNYVVSFLTG